MNNTIDCKKLILKWKDLNRDLFEVRANFDDARTEDILIVKHLRDELKNSTNVCDSLTRVMNMKESLNTQIHNMKN